MKKSIWFKNWQNKWERSDVKATAANLEYVRKKYALNGQCEIFQTVSEAHDCYGNEMPELVERFKVFHANDGYWKTIGIDLEVYSPQLLSETVQRYINEGFQVEMI